MTKILVPPKIYLLVTLVEMLRDTGKTEDVITEEILNAVENGGGVTVKEIPTPFGTIKLIEHPLFPCPRF